MKHLLLLTLATLILTACGPTGYGPSTPPDGLLSLAGSRITPRSKGGTLNITPQTKGSTLKGSVVWPAEAAALASRRFQIRVYAGDTLLAAGSSDAEARFTLTDVPAGSELRLEAQVPGRAHVILRALLITAEAAEQTGEISMLSTAALAVLADAQAAASPTGLASAARLLEADTRPLLEPLARLMAPYLDLSLPGPLESQPAVRRALTETRQQLDRALRQ